jgi:hypothetical protein
MASSDLLGRLKDYWRNRLCSYLGYFVIKITISDTEAIVRSAPWYRVCVIGRRCQCSYSYLPPFREHGITLKSVDRVRLAFQFPFLGNKYEIYMVGTDMDQLLKSGSWVEFWKFDTIYIIVDGNITITIRTQSTSIIATCRREQRLPKEFWRRLKTWLLEEWGAYSLSLTEFVQLLVRGWSILLTLRRISASDFYNAIVTNYALDLVR